MRLTNTARKIARRWLVICCGLMFAAGISSATESLLRAERPQKSAQQLYTEGVVVGDEAFLYLPVASTFDGATGRYGARTLFRYRDGSDPVPMLSLSEAKVYSAVFSAKMAYDPVSGRFAAAGQVTGCVGANTNPIVVIDPGPTAKVHVVSRNGRLNGRPVFSPDGQWLAFLSSPADAWDWEHRSVKGLTLRVIHLATLKETELSPAAFKDIRQENRENRGRLTNRAQAGASGRLRRDITSGRARFGNKRQGPGFFALTFWKDLS